MHIGDRSNKLAFIQNNIREGKTDSKMDSAKDQVILGRNVTDDKNILMEKPLCNMKSSLDPGPTVALSIGTGVVGGLMSGAGVLGKHLGGIPGVIIASALSSVAGGFANSMTEGTFGHGNFIKGSIWGGGLATTGALLGLVNTPLALTAGFVAGTGTGVAKCQKH